MIKIEVKNGLANVYTPYNPDFVKKIKGIGGATWDCSKKCWTIPETAIRAAREIMTDVYGYSDIKENEVISLRVTFNNRVSKCKTYTEKSELGPTFRIDLEQRHSVPS